MIGRFKDEVVPRLWIILSKNEIENLKKLKVLITKKHETLQSLRGSTKHLEASGHG